MRRIWWLLIGLLCVVTPLHAQQACAGFLPSRLVIGQQGRVLPGEANNVRTEPSRDAALVGQIPGGAVFTVLDGPICGTNTAWWQVDYQGLVGWTVEGIEFDYFVEPVTAPPANAAVGTPIVVPLDANAITVENVLSLDRREIDFTNVQQVEVSRRWLAVLENDGLWLKDRLAETGAVLIVRQPVHRVAISPDDLWIVYSTGNAISILDPLSSEVVFQINLEWFRPEFTFSPDGRLLVLNFYDGVQIHYLADHSTHTLTGEQPRGLGFNADGTRLAVMFESGTMRFYETQNWEVVQTLSMPNNDYIPDGELVFGDHRIWFATNSSSTVWDLQSSERIAFLSDLSLPVAFSPDGSLLAGMQYLRDDEQPRRVLSFLEVESGRRVGFVELDPQQRLNDLTFSPDGAYLYSASETLTEWTVGAGDEVRQAAVDEGRCPGFLESRLTVGNSARVLPNISGAFLRAEPNAVSSILQTLASNTHMNVLEGPSCTLGAAWWRVSVEGIEGWIAEGQADVYTLQPVIVLVTPEYTGDSSELLGSGTISQVVASSDGTLLAVGSSGGVWLYDTSDFETVPRLLYHDGESIEDLDFNPTGSLLATVSVGRGRVWNTETALVVDEVQLDEGFIRAVAFSPDGGLLAFSDSENYNTGLWSVDDGYVVDEIQDWGHELFFSPDGRRVFIYADFTGEGSSSVKLWNIGNSHEPIIMTDGFVDEDSWGSSAHNPTLSPNGFTLATLGYGIALWNATTGAEQGRLNIPSDFNGSIEGLVFHPDGTRLISGGDSIRVWDVTASSPVLMLSETETAFPTRHVMFNQDGSMLLASGAERTVIGTMDEDTVTILAEIDGANGFFLADGRIVTYNNNRVYIWSSDGQLVAELAG
jgi:WD40 repeat protein